MTTATENSEVNLAAEAGESLLDQVMQETRMSPGDDGFDTARRGVEAFISDLLKSNTKVDKVEKKLVDDMISAIDEKISAQLDEIVHAGEFKKVESAWRGLHFLVKR